MTGAGCAMMRHSRGASLQKGFCIQRARPEIPAVSLSVDLSLSYFDLTAKILIFIVINE